jgi:uncharacterized protein DUF1761
MSEITQHVNWLSVAIGTIIAFILGAAWYSTKLFGAKWAEGVGAKLEADSKPPLAAMLTQFIATFMLAWVIAIMAVTHALYTAILIVLMLIAMIAANGLFAGKSHYAIATESGFIAVISTIMIICEGLLRDVGAQLL